jgi:hypothetical protein
MNIKLDITKRQLAYLISAMSKCLRMEDVKDLLNNPEVTWKSKSTIVRDCAERCELLAMLDRTFDTAREDDDD